MRDADFLGMAAEAVLFFVPFLFALCFHEFAHGWVARRKGDRTAELMGRLTLNPLAHADPIGTFALPLIALFANVPLFGWAKPVPVDARNFKNPRQDMFWVAAAGPLSNVLLAIVGSLILAGLFVWWPGVAEESPGALRGMLRESPAAFAAYKMTLAFLQINIVLAIFNLIPIHPLDGAKVLARFLPARVNRWLEDNEQFLATGLLLVMVLGGLAVLKYPVAIARHSLEALAAAIAHAIGGGA